MNAVILNGTCWESVYRRCRPGPTSSALMSDLLSILRGNIKLFGVSSKNEKPFFLTMKTFKLLYLRFEA